MSARAEHGEVRGRGGDGGGGGGGAEGGEEWAERAAVAAHVEAAFADSPSFLFYVCKSTNNNIVCYQADLHKDEDGAEAWRVWREPSEPVAVFWQLIDPETVAERARKGKLDVTSELTYVQRKMAYGCAGALVEHADELAVLGRAVAPDAELVAASSLSLVALPQRAFFVVVYDAADGRRGAAALTTIGGAAAVLSRVFVHVVPGRWISAWPTVTYIVLCGVSLVTGDAVEERVVNDDKKAKGKKKDKDRDERVAGVPPDFVPVDVAAAALLGAGPAPAPASAPASAPGSPSGSASDGGPGLSIDLGALPARLRDDGAPSPLGKIRRKRRRRRKRRTRVRRKVPLESPSASLDWSNDDVFATAEDIPWLVDNTPSDSASSSSHTGHASSHASSASSAVAPHTQRPPPPERGRV